MSTGVELVDSWCDRRWHTVGAVLHSAQKIFEYAEIINQMDRYNISNPSDLLFIVTVTRSLQ